MINKKILLHEEFPGLPAGRPATLVLYLPDNHVEIEDGYKRPCVLVCPGGGYVMTSEREAEPLALRFAGAGIGAAVLYYSTAAHGVTYPQQLLEASAAMTLLRRNADEWNIAADKIAVMGFSAGGHLAASLSNLWHLPRIKDVLGIQHRENRPDASILCYPVITSGEKAHRGSFEYLLNGSDATEEEKYMLSLENSVTDENPPGLPLAHYE